jgi:hypothetical protein
LVLLPPDCADACTRGWAGRAEQRAEVAVIEREVVRECGQEGDVASLV